MQVWARLIDLYYANKVIFFLETKENIYYETPINLFVISSLNTAEIALEASRNPSSVS